MKTQCIVLDGRVINVGPWRSAEPLPVGAQNAQFDIATTASGRIVLAADYRTLRAAEYPPIGDQLDALFKAGMFPPEMAALLAAVKAKYPKP